MNRNNNNADDRFHLVELFLVAADICRTFIATRLRKKDDQGQEFVFGSVCISEGVVVSAAVNEEQVESYLDDLCKLKLDRGLHQAEGKSCLVFHDKFIHN